MGAHRSRRRDRGSALDTAMQRRGGSFFGRRKGKRLRPGQRQALDDVLPTLLIDPNDSPPDDLRTLFDASVSAVRLEIGFGGGEHLVHEAKAHLDTGFIGVEPFENGMAKAVVAIANDAVTNVRLYDQDAALLLDWLPPESLERIDLLYPDPWPKKRHWKRRFVNAQNVTITDSGALRTCEARIRWRPAGSPS